MSYRKEPCRNFQRGSCHYGDRCRYLHVSQQQPKPSPFGFGNQSNSQFNNTSQQQKPNNPFGFGVQNSSGNKGPQNFGGRNETPTKPSGNTWTRPTNAATTNSSQKGSTQAQTNNHVCTDPETCKHQMVEDFKNEMPLWRLTCYGHWKNFPCDIVGDVSYEELRAAAYDDARKGIPLQAIIERERNMYNAKSAEFDNLLHSPFVKRSSSASQPNPFPVANTNISSFGSQSNAPPSFSSFSQLGSTANLGPSVRPPAPATPPNSNFGQPNLPQYNSQGSGGIGMSFGSSGHLGGQLPTQPSVSSPGLFGSQLPTQTSTSSPGLFGSQRLTQPSVSSPGLFGSQSPPQPFGNAQGPSAVNLQSGGGGIGGVSSPFGPPQLPSSTSNKSPSFLDGPGVTSGSFQQSSTSDKQEETPDDSIWLKKQWAVGEIPTVAPPERFCT